MEETVGFSIEANTNDAITSTNKLTTAINKLTGTLEESGKKGQTAGEGITAGFLKAQVIFAAVQKAGELLFGTFKAGFDEVNETNAAMAQAAKSAKMLGISFSEIQRAAESLVNPVQDSTDQLMNLNKLLAGGFKLDQAKEMVAAFSDIAATSKGMGESVQQNMQTLIDAVITGRVRSAELRAEMPLVAQAVEGFTSKTTDAEKKLAIFNAVMEQGKTAAGGLAEYLQKPQGALEAFSKALENLKESFATGILQGGAGLSSLFADLLKIITNLGSKVEYLGSAIGRTLSTAIRSVIGDISDWESKIGDAIDNIARWLDENAEDFARVGKSINDAITQTSNFFAAFKKGYSDVNPGTKGLIADLATILEHLTKINSIITGGSAGEWAGKIAGFLQKSMSNIINFPERAKDFVTQGISSSGIKGDLLGQAVKPQVDIIDTSTIEDASLALQDLNRDLSEYVQKTGEAGNSTNQLSDDQQRLLDKFNAQLSPLSALEKEYKELAAVGVEVDQFVKVYWEDLLMAADAQSKNVQAASEFSQKLVEQATKYKEVNDQLALMDVQRQNEVEKAQQAVEANNALLDVQDKITEVLRTQSGSWEGIISALVKYGDGVTAYNPDLQEFYDKLIASRDALLQQADANNQAAAAAEKAAQAFADEMAKAEGLGRFFSFLSSSIGGFFGSISGHISNGINAFAQLRKDGFSKTDAAIGGLGAALQGLGDQIGGTAGKIVSAAGTIASAFAMGGPWGAAIAAIGIFTNVLLGMFKHDWKADANNIIEAIHGITGASQEMKDQVAALAEEIGDADTAFILSLNDIMDDVGVTAENFDQFAQSARDVFSFLERGQIDAAQASEILSGAFERLLDIGTDSFGLISDELKELIALSKQFGLEVPAITEFLKKQADDLAAGVATIIQGTMDEVDKYKSDFVEKFKKFMEAGIEGIKDPGTKDRIANALKETMDTILKDGLQLDEVGDLFDVVRNVAQEFGMTVEEAFKKAFGGESYKALEEFRAQAENAAVLLLTSFNQIIENGGSVQDALAQLGPSITDLKGLFKELGMDASDFGLSWIFQLNGINQKYKEQLTQLQGVSQALVALENLGALNAKSFAALQKTASDAFKDIMKDGVASKAELQAMAPTLALLAQMAEKYGFALDANTLALIEQAKKMGLLKDSDPGPTLESSMMALNDTLTALNTTLQQLTTGAQGFGDALGQIPTDLEINVGLNVDDSALGKIAKMGSIGSIPSFAGLGDDIAVVRSKSAIVEVHKGEKISGVTASVGSSGVTVNVFPSAGMDETRLARKVKDVVMQELRPGRSLNGLRK